MNALWPSGQGCLSHWLWIQNLLWTVIFQFIEALVLSPNTSFCKLSSLWRCHQYCWEPIHRRCLQRISKLIYSHLEYIIGEMTAVVHYVYVYSCFIITCSIPYPLWRSWISHSVLCLVLCLILSNLLITSGKYVLQMQGMKPPKGMNPTIKLSKGDARFEKISGVRVLNHNSLHLSHSMMYSWWHCLMLACIKSEALWAQHSVLIHFPALWYFGVLLCSFLHF